MIEFEDGELRDWILRGREIAEVFEVEGKVWREDGCDME